MKKELIEILKVGESAPSDWDIEIIEEDTREIRKGNLKSKATGRVFQIEKGVLNMLPEELPPEVEHEKEHAEEFDYLITDDGGKHPINQETISKFKDLFLSLPTGDGSRVFQPGGSFDNQAGNAERFFKTLDLLNLTGKERVLEVGASFTWGSWRFAQKGCEVVALDVTNYLETSDIYFEKDNSYYHRVMADMSQLPFQDNSFDLIFSHSVIHHCKDLDKLFKEFHRVLRPGGRVAALHECSFGLLEDKSGKALQEAIDHGFNENAYTIPQWKKGAKDGGFSKVDTHFFSLIDDYVYRKKIRNAKLTWKLKLAMWFQKYPALKNIVNWFSIPVRILLRPKAWMMITTKF